MRNELVIITAVLALAGCGTSQQFIAVPPDIDRENVPKQTIEMTAERFHFTPEELHVSVGTLVTLKITAIDGTHGFNLGAFGIDETLEEDQTEVIEFYASQKGEYGFKCSHFCGIGHLWMNGNVVIE
jgi:heme/copper-type cytochrome/quinol oxidase subunit 2